MTRHDLTVSFDPPNSNVICDMSTDIINDLFVISSVKSAESHPNVLVEEMRWVVEW